MTATAPLSPSACSRCGRALPTDAPAGLCPRCLLSDGFGNQSEFRSTYRAAAERRFIPPTIDELAAEFPQLEFIQLLGSGGMGAVYLAKQIRLDRKIAVKILPPDLADDAAFAERFLREARALARLSHPNIVGVFDFGQSPGGLYYFLMEYIEGPTLRQVVATRSADPKQALEIVRQVCDALQFAHDKGVVHRDIKPENILLDSRGRVKIADFGLAKLLGLEEPHPGSPAAGSLTGTRQAMGTPHYMAPEQITGSRAVDHRADIYSLGVVFYELLTGELPLGRFAPPSKKVQIDVRLDEVVLRTLESEPAQRYQHASDVKTDVETISLAPHQPPSASLVGANAMRFVRDAGTSAKTAARTMLAPPGPGETSRMAIFAILWAAAVPVVLLSIMFYETFERWLDPLAVLFAIIGFAAAIPAITAPIGTTILGILSLREIRNSNGRITGLVPGFAAAVFFPILLLNLLIWCIGLPPAVLIVSLIGSRDDVVFIALTAIFTFPFMCWADICLLRVWWRKATDNLSPELVERELRAIPRPLRTAGAALVKGVDRFNHELLHLFGKARDPEHGANAHHPEPPVPPPKEEHQPTPHDPLPAQAPLPSARMSLKAIIGACFLLGLPLAIICGIAAVQFQRTDAIELPLWGLTFLLALIPLFATTILGWIAIGEIRASNGRLTGLPLALFDALFFPLLFLDAFIAFLSVAITGLVAWGLAVSGQTHPPTPAAMIAILFGHLIGIAIIAIVDTLIVRAVWRRVKPQPILRAAEDESSISSESDTSSPEQESFFRKHRELIAAGAAIGAATLLFAIKATHEGWGPFAPETSVPHLSPPDAPTAPTRPGLPRAATDEQARQYVEDTNRRWRLGPNGPELSPGWADTALRIDSAAKQAIDDSLQRTAQQYSRLLDAHTSVALEGEEIKFTVEPFEEQIDQLTNQFWSEIDPLLTREQQSIMRYNFPLRSQQPTPGHGVIERLYEDKIMPFGTARQIFVVRIGRTGAWYTWALLSPYSLSSSAPEVPLWLRHWQDRYDQLISLHRQGLNVDPTRWPLVAPKPNPSLGAAGSQEGPTANNPEYEHLYRQLAQWKVDPQSIRHIDRIIRMIEFEYDDILKAHTIERVDNDTVIFEVRPFPDKIAPLERQFWDLVDPLLTVEQQRIMRLNFPVGELPTSTAQIKGDDPTGLMRLGRHSGMTLRVEKFGHWYRWNLDLYTAAGARWNLEPYETPSLPYWLRSFQKRVDTATGQYPSST